ncbi:ubiquitin conjugating [Phlyctema vagabunda]|uniref:Ubiquitin conjugating n=1 Tax=Phlyctema vagabunda TaxID=108571 RepID=A0ABR4PCX4_9HELO
MHVVVRSLVRRGVEATTAYRMDESGYEVPKGSAVLMGTTVLVFLVMISLAEYTFARLIPTLMMVESPQAVLFEPLSSEDPDKTSKGQAELDLFLVKPQPITTTFRSTLKHLRARAGRASRFRGFASFLVYTFATQHLAFFLSASALPGCVPPVVAAVVCAQLSMLWTHVVITEPSTKRWYQRIPSFQSWKKVAGPTAILAIAEQLSYILPAYLFVSYGLDDMTPQTATELSKTACHMVVIQGFSVVLLSAALSFLIVVPANVSLTRVQASLLAETEDTIVPFDRTFGGKVTSESMGTAGLVGMLEAWKTFDWNSRARLLKAYAKAFSIQVALTMLMFITVGAQIMFVTGGEPQKLIPNQGNQSGEVSI